MAKHKCFMFCAALSATRHQLRMWARPGQPNGCLKLGRLLTSIEEDEGGAKVRELRETRPDSRVGCGWGHAWVHHGGAGAPLTAGWDAIATGADILVCKARRLGLPGLSTSSEDI